MTKLMPPKTQAALLHWHPWFLLRVGTMLPNSLLAALFSNCHLILLIVSIRACDTLHIPITSYKLDYTLTVAPVLPSTMSEKSINTLKPPSRCIVNYLGTVCCPKHIDFMENLEKIQISESGQPDGEISHLKRGNPLLHIVGRGGRGGV